MDFLREVVIVLDEIIQGLQQLILGQRLSRRRLLLTAVARRRKHGRRNQFGFLDVVVVAGQEELRCFVVVAEAGRHGDLLCAFVLWRLGFIPSGRSRRVVKVI